MILAAVAAVVLSGGGQQVIQARVSGISGSARFVVKNGRGELIVHDLTPPPAGDVYEVWLEPIRSPPLPTQLLFSPAAGASVDLNLPESLHGISRVLVTPEPAGGSIAPTHSAVIVVRLG